VSPLLTQAEYWLKSTYLKIQEDGRRRAVPFSIFKSL